MSVISFVLGLFSKRLRLQNEIDSIDRKITQINRQIGNATGRGLSALTDRRSRLLAQRARIVAELDALGG